MKRVIVDHFGGPEVVSVVEEGDPRPGPGEVRVQVLASGVSLSDAQMRAGTYLGGPKPPFTPGYELVGVIDASAPAARGCVWETGSGANAVGRQRGECLRSGEIRGRGARRPRPGRGPEPGLHLHDRVPDASPRGEGEVRGDGARARRGRQGGHRGPRTRGGGRTSRVRDGFRLATALRSSGRARWRSTTAMRTSWRGCES